MHTQRHRHRAPHSTTAPPTEQPMISGNGRSLVEGGVVVVDEPVTGVGDLQLQDFMLKYYSALQDC